MTEAQLGIPDTDYDKNRLKIFYSWVQIRDHARVSRLSILLLRMCPQNVSKKQEAIFPVLKASQPKIYQELNQKIFWIRPWLYIVLFARVIISFVVIMSVNI